MKRSVKIAAIVFASVIAVVLVAIGVLYFAKPGLLTAVYRGLILSQEDIEREKIENEEKLVNSINEYGFNLTLDDIEELNKGELSEQQIKDILMGKGTESGVLGETDSENPTDTDVKNQSNSDIENGENSENGTEKAGGGQRNENSNSATKPSADKTQSKPENNRTDNKGNSGASNTSNKQNTSNTSNSGTSSLSTTSKVEYEEQIADLIA